MDNNQNQPNPQDLELDMQPGVGLNNPPEIMDEVQDDEGVNDLPAAQVDQQPAPTPPVQPEGPQVTKPVKPAPVISDPVVAASTTGQDFKIDNIRDATDLNLSEAALMTKKKLASEPKVPFYLPFDAGESKGATRTATINGYPFTVKKGEYVELPKTVVQLFMKSMNMEAAALNNNPYNMSNPGSVNNPGYRKDAAI